MNNRRILQTIFVLAILVALIVAWPSIAGTARSPRAGDWVPAIDPGTRLTVVQQGYSVTLGLGETGCSIDFLSPDVGYTQLEFLTYAEIDGELGADADTILGRMETTPEAPTHEASCTQTNGYERSDHVASEITLEDGTKVKTTVARPMAWHEHTSTAWQTLAIAWDLGVLIEWSQTDDHLLIRRSPLPGTQVKWAGGRFLIGDQGSQFNDATGVARMFRARVGSRSGYENVQVFVRALEDGVDTAIFVK